MRICHLSTRESRVRNRFASLPVNGARSQAAILVTARVALAFSFVLIGSASVGQSPSAENATVASKLHLRLHRHPARNHPPQNAPAPAPIAPPNPPSPPPSVETPRPTMWRGQLIGDSYARRVVGSSRTTIDGIEVPPLLGPSETVRPLDDIRSTGFVQQRVPSATFSAVDDASPGGATKLVTTPGTDRWHEGILGIPRPGFLQSGTGQAAGQKTKSNRYGASLSGPIRKGSTHFYAHYLAYRQTVDRELQGYVPSASYRAAVKDSEPTLASILSAYPVVRDGATPLPSTITFNAVGSQIQSDENALLRVDQTSRPTADRPNPDALFARFNMTYAQSRSPLSGGQGYLRDTSTVDTWPLSVVVGWTHALSPRYLLNLRAAWLRGDIESSNKGPLNAPYTISIPGLTSLNGTQTTFATSSTYSLQDQIESTRGNHTIHAGVELRRVRIDLHSSSSGRVSFATLSAFSKNHVNWATYNQALPSNTLLEWQSFAWIQDDWKLRPNLVLGAGIRYEFFNSPRETHNKAIPFDFSTCGQVGFCPAGASFNRSNLLNFDPRVSIAWTPDRGPQWIRSNTVVRAGAAIYHADGLLVDQASPIYNEVQNFYLDSSVIHGLSYPVTPFLSASSAGIASAHGMSRDRATPYAAEWSLSVETQLARRWILTGTYFGAAGKHLPNLTYINLIDPASQARPYPAFGQVSYRTNSSSSNLHVFAMTATYATPGGGQLMGGYNWAHEIDNDASYDLGSVSPQDPACLRCERASGDFDIRHYGGLRSYYPLRFGGSPAPNQKQSVLHRMLKDWALLTDFYGSSPLPVNVTIERSISQVATGYTLRQRPDRVPGVSIRPPGGPTVSEWLNPQAFTDVQGLYGTAGRNIARGPTLWALGSGLQRDLSLPKKIHLRLIVKSQNILNHANYTQPFADWSSPQFGKIINPYNGGNAPGPRALFFDFSVSR